MQLVTQAILATDPSQAAVQLAQLLGPSAQGAAAEAAGHVQSDILEATQQLREELGERAGQLQPDTCVHDAAVCELCMMHYMPHCEHSFRQLSAHCTCRTCPAGWEAANLRLEAVTRVTCPKWHADHVGFRLLVTYSGPGTQYVSDDHAQRRWAPGRLQASDVRRLPATALPRSHPALAGRIPSGRISIW
jgi:hypothetical protein